MRSCWGLALTCLLAGCGGGSGSTSSSSTAIGYFKDSSTQGLRYVSGSWSGVTGVDGSFTYEVGQPVSFYLGASNNLPLGTSSSGKSVITPLDLVSGGSTLLLSVQNRVRFLMMLDTDNNPNNGITISSSVQVAASMWPTLNFNQSDTSFDTAVAPILTSVNTADSRVAVLPSAATAMTHVNATLRCTRSGGFRGTYGGSDRGPISLMVDAETGYVLGYFNSAFTPGSPPNTISAAATVSFDQTGSFSIPGSAISNNTSFSGTFSSPDTISGTWNLATNNGNFSIDRIGGLPNASHRFTSVFSGSGSGIFTFDVSASGGVTGIAYDATNDSQATLSGTVSGTTLTGQATDGTVISGALNTSNGTLSGTWSKPPSYSGTFTGSGCKLS